MSTETLTLRLHPEQMQHVTSAIERVAADVERLGNKLKAAVEAYDTACQGADGGIDGGAVYAEAGAALRAAVSAAINGSGK